MEIKFNVNNYVKVKLTELGKNIYQQRMKELNNMSIRWHFDTEPKLDEEGYYKAQLHEIMNMFGSYCQNGFDIPFETNIILLSQNNQNERK